MFNDNISNKKLLMHTSDALWYLFLILFYRLAFVMETME